jgi:hypothetical protein
MADTTSDVFHVVQTLRKWAILVLGVRQGVVLSGPFQGVRPNTAYIEIEPITSVRASEPWAEIGVDDDGNPTKRFCILKRDTFQMKFFGADSLEWPERLERSRPRPDVCQLFSDSGCNVYASDILRNRDIVRDNVRWELGAMLEVHVSYISIDESVTYTGTPLLEVDVANNPAPLYDVVIEVG